jgi:hypothetical protein
MKIQTPSAVRLAPALSVLFVAACSTISEPEGEVQLRSMIAGDTAPAWVTGQIPTSPGTVAFVGRGGGFDVLDERHAFDEALGHARTQLAHYVATEVTSEACLRDISIGARFLPRDMPEFGAHERVNQDLRSRAHEITDVLVGGVAAADQHWERWEVSNGRQWDRRWMTDRRAGIQRYKCWVLAIVDLDSINRYVESALRALENEAAIAEAEAEAAIAVADAEAEAASAVADAEARAAELEFGLAEAAAQNAASMEDLAHAGQVLNASAYELQRLRERVHYGRRFRLTGTEDCLHFRAPCDFEHLHPEWRSSECLTRTEVRGVGIEVAVMAPAVGVPAVEAPDEGCCELCDLGLHGG